MDSRIPTLTIALQRVHTWGGGINCAAATACMSQPASADVLGKTHEINQSTSSQFNLLTPSVETPLIPASGAGGPGLAGT
jgi:hypothetical protein